MEVRSFYYLLISIFKQNYFFSNLEYSIDESVVVKCTVIDAIEFGEYEKKKILMTITTEFVGYLRIIGIVGKISSATDDKIQIWGKLNFDKIPLKVDNTSNAAAIQAKQDYDRKLEIQILPPTTAMKVRFTEFPREVLSGEVFEALIEISNSSTFPISEIYIASNSPKEFLIKSNGGDLHLSIAKGNNCYFY